MFIKKSYQHISSLFVLIFFLIMLSFSVRAEVVDEVVAVVNNEIITLSELARVAQANVPNGDSYRYREVLEGLIDQKLIDQATKDMQINVSEKEIDEVIQAFKESNKITDVQLQDALRQQGLTWEKYRKEIRDGLRRKQAIAQTIRPEFSLSDKEIKDFYEKHPDDFLEPSQVKIEQIFFPFPDQATPEKKKEVSQSAEESLKKIKSGENFQKVAQKCNLPENSASCDIGTYKRGELTDALDQEAFALKPGEISNIIPTDKGCCIIRVLERSEEKTKGIEDARQAISNYLFQQKIGEKLQEWIEELRANAYIDIKI